MRDKIENLPENVEYHSNIFDDEMLEAAAKVLPTTVRKVRWDDLDDNPKAPNAIIEMKNLLLEKFPYLKLNTSILKRYSQGEESGAYSLHRDPEEFMKAPLVYITLSGEAVFSLTFDQKLISVRCRKGTVIILKDPTINHVVTPPGGAQRMFLFFGWSEDNLK